MAGLLDDEEVVARERMAVLAMARPVFLKVIQLCHWAEVLWIDAVATAADVMDLMPIWDRPEALFVDMPVCVDRFPLRPTLIADDHVAVRL